MQSLASSLTSAHSKPINGAQWSLVCEWREWVDIDSFNNKLFISTNKNSLWKKRTNTSNKEHHGCIQRSECWFGSRKSHCYVVTIIDSKYGCTQGVWKNAAEKKKMWRMASCIRQWTARSPSSGSGNRYWETVRGHGFNSAVRMRNWLQGCQGLSMRNMQGEETASMPA